MHEIPPSIEFPANDEEHARRIVAEAQRLADLSVPREYLLWIDKRAETLGVARAVLEALVKANIQRKEREARERKAEERRQEKRLETAAEREERKREREQERVDKEAARKRKDKEKGFAALLKLPSDQFESQLAELARRLGEDPATLREEFEAFSGGGTTLGDLLTPAKSSPLSAISVRALRGSITSTRPGNSRLSPRPLHRGVAPRPC